MNTDFLQVLLQLVYSWRRSGQFNTWPQTNQPSIELHAECNINTNFKVLIVNGNHSDIFAKAVNDYTGHPVFCFECNICDRAAKHSEDALTSIILGMKGFLSISWITSCLDS